MGGTPWSNKLKTLPPPQTPYVGGKGKPRGGSTRSFSKTMCLLQAARDGLMDVVEGHLALEASRMNDTDEDGLTAMHHAARYNRVNVLNRLVEAGGGELHHNITKVQIFIRW